MTLLDVKAFGFDVYFYWNTGRGWLRPSSEAAGRNCTEYWIGPIHAAITTPQH